MIIMPTATEELSVLPELISQLRNGQDKYVPPNRGAIETARVQRIKGKPKTTRG